MIIRKIKDIPGLDKLLSDLDIVDDFIDKQKCHRKAILDQINSLLVKKEGMKILDCEHNKTTGEIRYLTEKCP